MNQSISEYTPILVHSEEKSSINLKTKFSTSVGTIQTFLP